MSHQGQPEQISRDYVRLLMVMRRFIRDEFDVKVAISELNAVDKLLHYAGLSRNEGLQEMGKELHSMLVSEVRAEEPPMAQQKVHYYRGVAQTATVNKRTEAVSTPQKASSQRLYRGHVVVG